MAVSLSVSLLTIFSMMKLWNEAFWKKRPENETGELAAIEKERWTTMLVPISILAAITVAIGLGASPTFALALRAGEQLMNPAAYIQAVLEGAP